MTKWEYVSFGAPDNSSREKWLNKMGQEGWELTTAEWSGSVWVAFFKRPLIENTANTCKVAACNALAVTGSVVCMGHKCNRRGCEHPAVFRGNCDDHMLCRHQDCTKPASCGIIFCEDHRGR